MNMNFDVQEPWNMAQHQNITCTKFNAAEVKHGTITKALVKTLLCTIYLAQCFPLEISGIQVVKLTTDND